MQKKGTKVEDEDSDLDLEKDLFSIGTYLNNRPEMVEQMFHSLRGATLKRHIPDILKVWRERDREREERESHYDLAFDSTSHRPQSLWSRDFHIFELNYILYK